MKQQGPGNGTEGGRNPIHKQTRLCTTVPLGEEIISYKHIKHIFDLLHFEILLLALFKLLLTYHSFLIECFGII